MFLIVGLGNPGPKYLPTRHNAGFRAVDRISSAAKIPLYKTGFHSFYGKGVMAGEDVILAKPMTYMNNSGLAVLELSRFFRIAPTQILVIYDDLDLPFGTFRLRAGGGSGGHNGMKSVIFHLQTEDFPRMRIGVGRPAGEDAADYVLRPFSPSEEEVLDGLLAKIAEAAALIVENGILAAMNKFNAGA